jgi:hypothetical protein
MKAPSAKRETLFLIAGSLWLIVGLVLVAVAVYWLWPISRTGLLILAGGILGAIIIHVFGLSRLAEKNINRVIKLAPEKEKICLFAFQNIRGYFVVLIMIALGYTLRHAPIQRIYIAPAYATMGLALIFSSGRYFKHSAL